ncbi:MAG: glycosyltransferase family 39 protein, partial [Bacteroidia bacterium]
FWIKIFGVSPASVRFPSLIFSSISVLYIYKLGTNFLNKRVGLYAAIIYILSNYHIVYSHEARVYSLLGMLAIMSMYYFSKAIQICTQKPNTNSEFKTAIRKTLAIVIVLNTLLIYSHYFGFFILITQFIFVLFQKELITKYWKQVLLCGSVIAVLYLPNILIVLERFIDSSSNGTWVKPTGGIASLYDMLRLFTNEPVVTVFTILLLVSALIKSVLNKRKESTQTYNRLVIFWFTFILFFMFGFSFLVPIFLDRYLMPAAIAFSLVVALSINYLLENQKYKDILSVAVCILFAITVQPNKTNKRDVKGTIDKVIEIKQPNTNVAICPSSFALNFAYYYERELFTDYNSDDIYSNIENALKMENIHFVDTIENIDVSEWDDVIYLDAAADFSYPHNGIKDELNKNHVLKARYPFYEIFNVYEYEPK